MGHKIVFSKRRVVRRLKKKTILSDLFCACILVRLGVQFVRHTSSLKYFQSMYRTTYGLNKPKKHGSHNE